jgi:predicted esterase YcpF (UPF0227 family)
MIYYIHGYLSSPDGSKATILKKELNAIPVKYRDVPPEELVIRDCLDEIKKAIGDDDEAILIGSSLGGCLVSKLALEIPESIRPIFLLNPAVIPPDVDIQTISDMPTRILQDMKDDRLFSKKLHTNVTVFSATNDAVVPPAWVIRFSQYQQATVQFLHDDHRFSAYLEQLPQLIRSFM